MRRRTGVSITPSDASRRGRKDFAAAFRPTSHTFTSNSISPVGSFMSSMTKRISMPILVGAFSLDCSIDLLRRCTNAWIRGAWNSREHVSMPLANNGMRMTGPFRYSVNTHVIRVSARLLPVSVLARTLRRAFFSVGHVS